MEIEEKNLIKKIRSSQACIKDGYQLYTANFRRIFRHTWALAIFFALITATASALPVLVSPTLVLPAFLLEVLSVILFLWTANRLLHKRQFLQPIEEAGINGWIRHLGMVILVGIVCLLIVSVLTLFTALPTIIMMAANWESQIGVIGGDPVGMPGYVTWLSIGAFLIAGFLQAYVWLTVICPFHLVHASIACQEKDRKEFNKKNYEKKNLIH